jgi:hypothetical protein
MHGFHLVADLQEVGGCFAQQKRVLGLDYLVIHTYRKKKIGTIYDLCPYITRHNFL